MLSLVSFASGTEPPELVGFDFDPKMVDTASSDQKISITLHLRDDDEGVSNGYGYFYSPSYGSGLNFEFSEDDLVSGDEMDGVYKCEVVLPQHSEQGVWKVGYIYLYDNEYNSRYLYQDDLARRGFRTNLWVFDSELTPGGIVVFPDANDIWGYYGQELCYNITICNVGYESATNVLVYMEFDPKVTLVSSSPSPGADGIWQFDVIEPGECQNISLILIAPIRELDFSMEQKVSGTGYVNVDNEYSDILESFALIKAITVRSDVANITQSLGGNLIQGQQKNELSLRKHGSGDYISEELIDYLTEYESKYTTIDENVSARHKETGITLSNNRSLNYTSRWSETIKADNRRSSASLQESYRYATSLDRKGRIDMSGWGLDMQVESRFEGAGHIGFLSNPDLNPEYGGSYPGYHPPSEFELSEDYVGSFKVYERVSSWSSEKSVEGSGFVSADTRIEDRHKTYEQGTGDYVAEEKIETYENYDKKSINISYSPVSQQISNNTWINQSMLWKEGIWSRSEDVIFMSEQFSDIENMKKETIASSRKRTETIKKENETARSQQTTSEMNTSVSFVGNARFQTIVRDGNIKDTWYPGDPVGIFISAINFDAEGDDDDNLNGEWVRITNNGPDPVNMTGWTLSDNGDIHVYVFPDFVLYPGADVTVFTGSGTDTAKNLYWGKGNAVWNNDGDTAILKDADGNFVDSRSDHEKWLSYDIELDDEYHGNFNLTRKISFTIMENTSTMNEEEWLPCELEEVYISAFNFDAPGNDYDNLNGEWVRIANRGNVAAEMSGWTLSDLENEQAYEFSEFTLDPGAEVTVFAGEGSDTDSILFMGFDSPVWDNYGETATLRDASGNVVSSKGDSSGYEGDNWLSCDKISPETEADK